MKIKRNVLTAIAALSLAAFLLPPAIVSAAEPMLPAATPGSDSVVSPLADDIRWVYYVAKDGKRYKRLYNYSTGDWIGEWIYVGG